MTKYNDLTCSYDAEGNPTIYKGYSATWTKGRKLASYRNTTFTYDGRGRRISKNGTTYTYDSADRLIKMSNGMEFFYDQEGVAGFTYGGAKYCYQKDLQGNILGIIDNAGQVVVQYEYDAWGYPQYPKTASSNYSTIASLNPFRYRGYIYDSETGFYYLQSRYYDPETCRFLNMDSVDYADPETLNGLNLYAYCNNNPVMGYDPTGHWDWGTFWIGFGMIATAVTAIALAVTTCGAGTPLAISIVAGVTATASVLTGVNGIATVIEAETDYNFVKDGVFQGNETAYNVYAGITEGIAAVGSMILGAYQSTGRFKASKQGRDILGKGYKSVGKDRWVSKDGWRQMRMDKPHPYKGEMLGRHINLESFKVNYWKNARAPINKKTVVHLVYELFDLIIK